MSLKKSRKFYCNAMKAYNLHYKLHLIVIIDQSEIAYKKYVQPCFAIF